MVKFKLPFAKRAVPGGHRVIGVPSGIGNGFGFIMHL
jgi:hypothetical protein